MAIKKKGLMAKAKKKRKKITLRQYYKTKHWSQLRNKYSYGDEAECQVCHSRRWENYKIGKKKGQRKPKSVNHLHLHHKHYDTMMNESRDDLMLLCDSCHKFFHQLEKMRKRSPIYEEAYIKLKNQSGWEFKKR